MYFARIFITLVVATYTVAAPVLAPPTAGSVVPLRRDQPGAPAARREPVPPKNLPVAGSTDDDSGEDNYARPTQRLAARATANHPTPALRLASQLVADKAKNNIMASLFGLPPPKKSMAQQQADLRNLAGRLKTQAAMRQKYPAGKMPFSWLKKKVPNTTKGIIYQKTKPTKSD